MGERLTDLEAVGGTAAARLRERGVTAADVRAKRVSRRTLLDAGLDPRRARRIREAHSLPWSLYAYDSDLRERAAGVRGLTEGERAWVAASADSGAVGTLVGLPDHRDRDDWTFDEEFEWPAVDADPRPTPEVIRFVDATDRDGDDGAFAVPDAFDRESWVRVTRVAGDPDGEEP